MALYEHRPTVVDAIQVDHDGTHIDDHGNLVPHKRGDYFINGVGDKQYYVERSIFEESYRPKRSKKQR